MLKKRNGSIDVRWSHCLRFNCIVFQLASFCLIASPLAIFQGVVSAGENEARAIAKLFAGDLITVQAIEDGFAPSDKEFMDAFTGRLMKAAEQDPELSELMKGPPPTPEVRATVMPKMLKKAGASEAEIRRFNTLIEASKDEPPTHQAGPIMKFRLDRADGVISFRMTEGKASNASDPSLNRTNKLLSSLRLQIDGSGAEFRGQPIGPAEWIDTTGRSSGRRRGLQWLARDADAKSLTLEVNGQNAVVSKIDATVYFIYREKEKRLILNMAIWPAGSSPASGETVRLAVSNPPSSSAP